MIFKPDSNLPVQSDPDTGLTTSPQDIRFPTHLDIPIRPVPRRSSYASTFSELSDLDYMSNDHRDGLLQRTISNASTYSNVGPVTFRQRLRNLYYQNYGAMLVLVAQIFGSGMNVATRLLEQPGPHGPPMHPFQILFTRQSLTALLCTTYALWTKSIPDFPLGPRGVRLLLISRGVCGFLGVCGMYFSLMYLPLSEATVLTFLAPILTCYLCSIVLLGETFGRQQQIAGFVSFLGVVCIAQPVSLFSGSAPANTSGLGNDIRPANTTMITGRTSDNVDLDHPSPSQHLFAIAIAMMGVLGATGAMTSIRAIGTRAHAFISVNYFSIWSTVVSLIMLIVVPSVSFRLPGNLTEWALLLSIGICGFIMQGLLTMGLAYGGPANTPNQKETLTASTNDETSTHLTSKAVDQDIEMQTHPVSPNPNDLSSSSSHHHFLTTPRPPPRHHHKRKPQPHPSGNRATSMVYCQMLFALAADKLIFGTTLGIWSWLGSGLILFGAVWVAAAKDGSRPTKEERASHSHARARRRRESVPDGDGFIVGTAERVGLVRKERRPVVNNGGERAGLLGDSGSGSGSETEDSDDNDIVLGLEEEGRTENSASDFSLRAREVN